MSLANLSRAYGAMAVRTKMAEDQCRDFEELVAQWFIDSHPGARDFLREIAKDHRERNPVKPSLYNTRQEVCSILRPSKGYSDVTPDTTVTSNS